MSSSSMGTHLPDEILSEILTPVLRVPDELFRDISASSPFLTYSESTSSALLAVSKSWLRVTTPLLYNVVVLRSKAQARALERALRGNKLLGTFIRKLRVEAGLGASMFGILERSPGITDVWLSLNLWSSDVVSGLCRGLPTINPRNLILFDSYASTSQRKTNATTRQLLGTLDSCIRTWKKLETITIAPPTADYLRYKYPELKDAVVAAPSLKTLIFAETSGLIGLLSQLSKNKSLQCIRVVHYPNADIYGLTEIEIFDSLEEGLALMGPHEKPRVPVYFERPDKTFSSSRQVGTSLSAPVHEISPKHQPFTSPIAALSSASDAVREAVFGSIIFHSLTIDECNAVQYYRRFSYFNGRTELSNKAVPQSIALVSKLFQNLALQHFYRYTSIFKIVQLTFMAHDIARNPSLGAHVRSLTFDPRDDFQQDTHHGRSLQIIIAHTPNLETLHGAEPSYDGQYEPEPVMPDLDLPILRTLADVAGASLTTLSGMSFKIKVCPTEVLCKFTALKRLEWPSLPTISKSTMITPNSLAHLTHLTYYDVEDDSFPKFLSRMELPAIKHLVVHAIEWKKGLPGLRTFLKKHGPKLETLSVNDPDACYCPSCPNLKVLNIREILEPGFVPHASLTKIILSGHTYLLDYASKTKIRETFNGLYEFELRKLYPALEEIQVYQCVWPTTEHDLKGVKGMWVKWSEKLAKWNIKLTDWEGRHWRPRLK